MGVYGSGRSAGKKNNDPASAARSDDAGWSSVYSSETLIPVRSLGRTGETGCWKPEASTAWYAAPEVWRPVVGIKINDTLLKGKR